MIAVQLLNGLAFGCLLFLMSGGLTLMYGLMGIINLAHGSYFMFGAYAALSTFKVTRNFLLAIVAGTIAGGVIGLLTERFLLRRLYGLHGHEAVLLTFALLLIIDDGCLWIWGGRPTFIPAPGFFNFPVNIFGSTYPSYRLVVILVGIMMAAGLWWFQEKTRWGAIIRAGVDDREMVGGLGINIPLVFTMVFALGASLAGFAGVMAAPILGVGPGLDVEVLVYALAVVIVGGLGSLHGCLIISLLFGIVDTLGKIFWPGFAVLTIYIMVATVLLIKPAGLFGKST
ncbi:MAG: branched-chain amino acid ABC transporter permease [Thermodesulfobacteriota bacterium]|nr:branched-chain amino acid ABC transporter permease [Thermodesulfobacteriota bacterium]